MKDYKPISERFCLNEEDVFSLFKVGEAILLTMPTNSCEDKNIVHEIKLI